VPIFNLHAPVGWKDERQVMVGTQPGKILASSVPQQSYFYNIRYPIHVRPLKWSLCAVNGNQWSRETPSPPGATITINRYSYTSRDTRAIFSRLYLLKLKNT
jgi:hypothetical protein